MAKIPFDIKYRPQIESGEYKVETRDGRPVRIICWDAKRRYGDSVCGFMGEEEDSPYFWQLDGSWWANRTHSINDIIIITPEPELSEFEKAIKDLVLDIDKGELQSLGVFEEENLGAWAVKKARELLELAKDEIYSHESLVEYAKKAKAEGKAEALKNLPRWKKCGKDMGQTILYKGLCNEENYLEMDGYRIMLSDLEKLPKED